MALWMNATFLKVLKEILLGLPIMESNVKRGNRGSEEDDLKLRGFLAGVDLCLGAMHNLSEKEKEREKTHHNQK